MMKNIAVALVVFLVISAHHMVTVVESSAFDCLDACITGCAAQYINNGRLILLSAKWLIDVLLILPNKIYLFLRFFSLLVCLYNNKFTVLLI